MENNKTKSYEQIQSKLMSGFFGFWVKNWKFTFLLMFSVIIFGILSMLNIKKESSPEIEIGVVNISTIYNGASPEDIDNLITDKIEKEIKDIDGIKKYTSSSRLGFSSINVELTNEADQTKVLVDIKDAVDKANLPKDCEDSIVTNIVTNSNKVFDVILYGDKDKFSRSYLLQKANELKKNAEKGKIINSVDIVGMPTFGMGIKVSDSDLFKYKVLVDKKKVENLGLSIFSISNAITSWNSNQPLGTHQLGTSEYEFRIQGEYNSIQDLLETSIPYQNGSILLKDIAKIQKTPIDDNIYLLVKSGAKQQNFITLTFNKNKGSNIFQASKEGKALLKKEFGKLKFKGLKYEITNNYADRISDDYSNLSGNGLTTLFLVFISLLIFVGIGEAAIATVSIPLAFFVSFIVLEKLGLSLNFLTNFSFIVAFGVAIDTTLVIIEGAHEKMKQGYNPLNSILLSVKHYKLSVIAGTATTVVVFIPLLSLPGAMGKFLAYIPITIFATLVAALFFSLTVNSALFFKLFKDKKKYEKGSINLDYLPEDEKILLLKDREGKEAKELGEKTSNPHFFSRLNNKREQMLHKLGNGYLNLFKKLFKTKVRRIFSVITPILCLIATGFLLGPRIGQEVIPSRDNDLLTFNIKIKKGTSSEITQNIISKDLYQILSKIPESRFSYYRIKNETVNGFISLKKYNLRKKNGQRDIFSLQVDLLKDFKQFEKKGYFVNVGYPKNGPNGSKAVGIKLLVESNDNFLKMLDTAEYFKNYLKSLEGNKDVTISSEKNPGQFQYIFDKNKLLYLGLNPKDLQGQIYGILNGFKAGTIKQGDENIDIEVLYSDFENGADLDKINNITLPTKAGMISVGGISSYDIKQSLDSISREDGKITLTVECDILPGYKANILQKKLSDFALKYDFPNGVSFTDGGEQADNSDLNKSLVSAFIFSLVMIFSILVLQFNSFSQPVIIMFSVIMGMFGTLLGLYITGNSFGMMMGIGFIALTGIVVNDAIVLIDKTNSNIKNGMPIDEAVINAGKTRLQPVILTTLTTVLGLVSLSTDKIFQPLAVTIMFGLTVSSTITLFIVPIIYYQIKKVKKN